MKEIHCRKCWQPVSRFSRCCDQCGQLDRLRFTKGVIEMSVYVAVGTAGIALAWFAVSLIVRGLVQPSIS